MPRRTAFLTLALCLSPSLAHAADACVSRYWEQVEALCTKAAAAAPPPAAAVTVEAAGEAVAPPPEVANVAAQTLKLCQPGVVSELASGSLSERQQELTAAAAALQIELGESTAGVELGAEQYLEALSQRFASNAALEGGAGMDLLVGELLGHLCAENGVKTWVPESCSPKPGGPALIALRRRLVIDLVTLPRRMAERSGKLGAASAELRESLSLLRAALSPDPIWQLVLELSPRGACSLAELSLPPAPDELGRAAQLLQRLLADGARLDRPQAYYEAVLQKELLRLRSEATLSPATIDATKRALQAFLALQRAAPTRGVETLEARLNDLVTLFQATLQAVSKSPPPPLLNADVVDLTRAALGGDLEELATRALALAQRANGVSASQAQAVETAVRFARARDEDEARRIVRSLILPLPRWSENVLFDLNGDVPSLKSGAFKVVGDALLGYNGRRWGIAVQGAVAEYDFSTATNIAETTALDGGLESWLGLDLDRANRAKLELRLFAKVAGYDTNHGSASGTFSDETSVMGRAGLLASLRYSAGERFAGGLWLGGGAQLESYDAVGVGNQVTGINDTESFGLLLNARARVELAIVPRWLVSRLRVDAQRYSLTRSSLNLVAGNQTVMAASSTLDAAQAEVRARLFLDAEVARFAGFVPALNVGFDSAFFSSTTESHSAFVPVFGAGLRRVAF
jgi:hypothetical protein